MIDNEKELSTSASLEAWEFINKIGGEGIQPLIPTIELIEPDGQIVPHIEGSAVLKGDRLVGFLNGEETKYVLFVKDEIEGGLLTETLELEGEESKITLEIFKSKASLEPGFDGDIPSMEVSIKVTVAIDEIMGTTDAVSEKGRSLLETQAKQNLKKNIENVIEKVQRDYGSDIFGFGNTIYRKAPREWKRFKDDWDRIFPQMQVRVTCDMTIEGSGLMSRPLFESE